MRKKIICITLAALLLTACGAKIKNDTGGYIAVYEEFTTAPQELVVITPQTEPVVPLTAENGFNYLADVLVIGDGVCGQAVEYGLLPEESIISESGAMPADILGIERGGKSIEDIVREADKSYIYLWFTESGAMDAMNEEKYGRELLELAVRLREICPESMVIPLSVLPFREGEAHADETDDYNNILHISVRSSPDVYLIYKNVSFVCAERSGYLDPKYAGEDGKITAEGWTKLFEYIERDRFYNDMRETGSKYDELYSERGEYTVTEGKVAYLTFDDGPSKYTPKILEILRENDIKATFFITGWCIDGREDTLRQVAEEGHTIGLHSWSHEYDEIYASKEAWLSDFYDVYHKVYAVTGIKPWSFRFPGGSYNNFNRDTADSIIAEMKKRGFAYFDWNAATSDASKSATYSSCMENLKESINADHEVVLMHDSLELTPQYLQEVIDYIKEQGYSFETIDTADEIQF